MQTILPHGVKLPPQKIKLPDQFSREKELREELSNLAVHSKLGNLIIYCKGWAEFAPPLIGIGLTDLSKMEGGVVF